MPTTTSLSDEETDRNVALVVDLDGTLCRTDTMHEALLELVATDFRAWWRLPGWLAASRASFKANLADRVILDPASLPMNEEVLELIRAARAEGRKTALVSAADHRQVTAVAEAIGLFDEAYGSAEGKNLKGAAKAEFLNAHFGIGNYEYIGDSKADLSVWSSAHRAFTVNAAPGLREAARQANPNVVHLSPPDGQAKTMLRALRPHQWSKNLLLFLPLLAAHDLTRLTPVFLGFLTFCLTASAVYVLNDLLDLSADRAHPRKRRRPFAAGELSASTGLLMVAGLLLTALILSFTIGSPLFLAIMLLYLVATFAYSFWLKRKLIIDVLMLAGLYTVRIIAGAAAAGVLVSPWFLSFSMFLFLALAAVKRQAELTDQLQTGRQSSGRSYEVEDLPVIRAIAITGGQAAVLVLALYISSDDVQELYNRPDLLWLLCPVLLYWAMRMVMKTHRGQMTDDPIVYTATDKVSLALIGFCVCLLTIAAL